MSPVHHFFSRLNGRAAPPPGMVKGSSQSLRRDEKGQTLWDRWPLPLRNPPGVAFGSAPGFYTGTGPADPKIFSYNPGRLMTVSAPILLHDMTVCANTKIWFRMCGWLIYALTITLIIIGIGPRDPDMDPTTGGWSGIYSNRGVADLEIMLKARANEFRFLIAFILSGFVAMTVGIWKERRQNYASLCGTARNLTINLASLMPFEPLVSADR
jgi:hypothetical protein